MAIFLRYFFVFLFIALITMAVIALLARYNIKQAQIETDPVKRANSVAAQAVRQLDVIINDPMKIGDPGWEAESKSIVNAWYGYPNHPRRPRKSKG